MVEVLILEAQVQVQELVELAAVLTEASREHLRLRLLIQAAVVVGLLMHLDSSGMVETVEAVSSFSAIREPIPSQEEPDSPSAHLPMELTK